MSRLQDIGQVEHVLKVLEEGQAGEDRQAEVRRAATAMQGRGTACGAPAARSGSAGQPAEDDFDFDGVARRVPLLDVLVLDVEGLEHVAARRQFGIRMRLPHPLASRQTFHKANHKSSRSCRGGYSRDHRRRRRAFNQGS